MGKRAPSTDCAQALHVVDPVSGGIIPPLQPSTTFARAPDYQLLGGRVYSRDEGPTAEPAEQLLARLEGGAGAMLFASGMASATAVFRALCGPGDHIVAQDVMYFGLRAWLKRMAAQWQVELDLVDASRTDELRRVMRPGKTRIVWIETPANPTWDVVDLAAAAEIAHGAGALLAVDSTVATPVHSRPIEHGADLVMHAATKYLNGHSDVLAGALVTARADEAWQKLHQYRHDDGACLGAFEAWLLLRGMRTLFPRVERQSATALELASRLQRLPGVRVLYPGLPSHPGHEVARRQMQGGFGGMLSVRLAGGRAAALAAAGKMEVFLRATSLGGVESLVEHRETAEGAETISPPDLLRLSIGIEDVEDLWQDLAQALRPA
ncbi:MAG TPA: PLP-dependent transferase [Polyangiaceae bacterium]|nr:PLP-dependent transferase [Polyangiaceae bacterium]